MGMHMTATKAVATRKAFEVLIAVRKDDVVDVAAVEALAADAAAKTVPAMAAGAAKAPIATAIVIVKIAVGVVRVKTVSMTPEIRSRSISRPRARRCFTASSVMPRASATARTDCPSR